VWREWGESVHAFYTMDPLEAAGGWLHGFDAEPLQHACRDTPRQVLERTLVRCLQRSPCVIAFSGGRDSSALLGAAVTVARREALPLPVTVTLTYPGVPQTDETSWQHQVLDHLGVKDRVEVTVDDEHDILGPITAPLLQRHGSLWPPNLAPTWRLMDQARGGVLIIGECGDEVFGIKRITPLRRILGARGRVDRRFYRAAAWSLAPAPMRRRAMLRSPHLYQRTWLRAPVKALLERRDVEDEAALALHAGHNARQYTHRRAICRSFETHRALGHDIDVDYIAPFADSEFVAAVAQAAGFWGWSGRTAAMTHLFGDLLPCSVLQRTSKATFERAVFTERGREFAAQWNGSGVDPDLVDPEALRNIWLSDQPDGGTMVLMQQAWLASQTVAQDTT
jgi:asparagine synthase (glutamine-hydrolysing)